MYRFRPFWICILCSRIKWTWIYVYAVEVLSKSKVQFNETYAWLVLNMYRCARVYTYTCAYMHGGTEKILNDHPYNLVPMMTSNGHIFRVTGLLCGEFTGHRWIPHTKASDAELRCFLWSATEPTVEQTMETQVIWCAITIILMSL